MPEPDIVRAMRVRPSTIFARCLPLAAVAFSASCGSANPIGNAIRPTTPTAASAVDPESIACRPHAYAEPLVIDMPADWRLDLATAMKGGVALVSYDCKRLRVIKSCQLTGTYGFAGIDRLSDVIHLEDSSQIGANVPLPVGGVQASLDRSSALDVAYVLVGKRSTPAAVFRALLQGDECDQVTHFVRAASVGAYAVATATKGSGAVAANVFGAAAHAAASSGKNTSTKAGDPDACNSSKGNDANPPDNCGSPFRLELSPVKDGAPAGSTATGSATDSGAAAAAPKQADVQLASMPDPCPEGFKLTAGKCAPVAAIKGAHLCAPDDRTDCDTQCTAGDVGSCFNLATLVRTEAGGYVDGRARSEPTAAQVTELKRAVELDKRACAGGHADGCWEYGKYCPIEGEGDNCTGPQAAASLDKGCKLGSAKGCAELAWGYLEKSADLGLTKDEAKGAQLYRRACDLGDKSSCTYLAGLMFSGEHMAKDPAAGDKLLSQFCAQGDMDLCRELAFDLVGWQPWRSEYIGKAMEVRELSIKTPAEIPDALPRARTLLTKVCKADANFCDELAAVLAELDEPDARAKLTALCPDDKKDTAECAYLGVSLFDGKGGPADKKRGIALMANGAVRPVSFRAATILKKGDGVKKDPKRADAIMTGICGPKFKDDFLPWCKAWKAMGSD
jgi:TPR repeat protein